MVRTWYDLEEYIGLRRVNGLVLAPDGTRLIAPVSELAPDGAAFRTALWEIDPAGGAEPRRLTRSAAGEGAPAFLPDGSLLFTSARPDPDSAVSADAPALWLLPAGGGEAHCVAERPGGFGALAVAREAGTVAFTSEVHPGAADTEADARARKARKDAGVSAILHESVPVRVWDRDLGPDRPRLFAAAPPAAAGARLGEAADLTPDPGLALHGSAPCISPDGATAVVGWSVDAGRGVRRDRLVAVDTATGERRVLAADPERDFGGPAASPDGRGVVALRDFSGGEGPGGAPPEATLWFVDLATGEGRDLLAGYDLWPREYVWTPDSAAVLFTADDQGRCPVFRVETATGGLTRITADDGTYTHLNPAPAGTALFALRCSWDEPPAPARIDDATGTAGPQHPVRLPAPEAPLEMPGVLTETAAEADDGTRIRAWLVLPSDASAAAPAPLVLWVHGGPYMSFNGWSWRWNPWLLAARGYAVLLPDPALSTGYGPEMRRRGRAAWGERTLADLMAVTDAAASRDDVDGTRTAAMGGSFGGYMANWIAGHTDRFDAVVTHASLWSLEAFAGATDYPWAWTAEYGDPLERPERYRGASPQAAADSIRTPMLVIHGDKDYRVPIGEGLRLWWDLVSREVDAKFLYFPDENHWVTAPGNIRVWYGTVLAFLDHHVLGRDWQRPPLL
ncbi:S9 family peptidase [Streptomonospora salina]|uniref:Dipeptidyl aminopeptidase/acylaminoacyl peptidase n=1 Tax=Streptomonospora salina TaxID=104205 RepID=A0A841EDR5_9ACTN|nr:alpha/beta fold hydrolase [Streptomonospora salina]MBB6001275.1 dipeptidyl aminopeptidase/acylaminoacyl peptidase [Streptomonospora salina]